MALIETTSFVDEVKKDMIEQGYALAKQARGVINIGGFGPPPLRSNQPHP